MEEIQAAVEIVKVPLQVGTQAIEVAARVTESSVQTMMALAKFVVQLKKQLEKECLYGETELRNLVTETQGDLQVYQFPEDKMSEVKEVFDKLAIRYAPAEDLNAGDGMSELFFPTNNLKRAMLAIQKLEAMGINTRVMSKEDYINNADEEHQKEMQDAVDALGGGDVQSTQMTQEPGQMKPEMEQMKQRLVYDELIKDKNMQLFTVNKNLIVDENEQYYVSRIPRTEQFVQFRKDMCFIKDNGNTFCFFEKKNADVSVLSRTGDVIDSIPVWKLYNLHYDSSWKKNHAKNQAMNQVMGNKHI